MNDSRRDDRSTPKEGVRKRDVPHDPMAGVHGAPPHTTRGLAEDPDTDDARDAALVERLDPDLETPSLRPAVLGRLEGLGVMTMVHDAEGHLLDTEGTWRPADETATLDELRETFPVGSVTTFAGTLVESRHESPAEDVSMQVIIKRHGEYEEDGGLLLRVVNFVPRDHA